MKAEREIYYGRLTQRGKKDLFQFLDRYTDQFVRITLEELNEDTSQPVRLMLPEHTRDRLKRSKYQFNALRDRPISTAQYINYLLDREEERKNNRL